MSAYRGNLLQNSKMRGRQNSAARPSGRVFGDPTPCKEPTKAAGWKSDQSCDPLHKFRIGAPAPLENFVCSQKQSFATDSALNRKTYTRGEILAVIKAISERGGSLSDWTRLCFISSVCAPAL